MQSLSSVSTLSCQMRCISSRPRGATCFAVLLIAATLPSSFVIGSQPRNRQPLVVTMRSAKNPYDVIGVPRGAPSSEVRRFFRKLALTKHPDVNPKNPRAAEEFKELASAYNSIMRDELSETQVSDELEQMRAEARAQYEKGLKKQLNEGTITLYLYRFFELSAGLFLLWTTTQGPEVLSNLGILPENCNPKTGKCSPVNASSPSSSPSSYRNAAYSSYPSSPAKPL